MGRSGKAMRHVMVAVLFATLLVSTIGPVALHAAGPYVVNSIADDDDASAGDGLCMTALNECTLRAAIQQANADGAATTINFGFSGSGVHTITTTHLPGFPIATVPLIIDGRSQTGWVAATAATPATIVIEIDCRSSSAECFQLRGATNTVRGLAINHAGTAIVVQDNPAAPVTTVTNTVIAGNHLGTNPAGTAASPPLKADPNANVQRVMIVNRRTSSRAIRKSASSSTMWRRSQRSRAISSARRRTVRPPSLPPHNRSVCSFRAAKRSSAARVPGRGTSSPITMTRPSAPGEHVPPQIGDAHGRFSAV